MRDELGAPKIVDRSAFQAALDACGLDGLWSMYQWLDRVIERRNKTDIWWRRHDEFEKLHELAGCYGHGGGA